MFDDIHHWKNHIYFEERVFDALVAACKKRKMKIKELDKSSYSIANSKLFQTELIGHSLHFGWDGVHTILPKSISAQL